LPTDADPALEAEDAVDDARSSAQAGNAAVTQQAAARSQARGWECFIWQDSMESGARAGQMRS
ncbi:MAG: hypothetical protein ACOVPA_22340, partial [Rubrivivax sp.]